MSHEEEILQRLSALEADVRVLTRSQPDILQKLDSLAAVANIGRGALWAALKLGAALAALGALTVAMTQWGVRT